MKFQPQRFTVPSIVGYGPGWLMLSKDGVSEKIERSVVIGSRGEKFDWPCTRFEALAATHFEVLAQPQPEVVIFGSGQQLRFVRPSLLRSLIDRGIGVETMDTPSACRTYNILADEGRHVVAALLVEEAKCPSPNSASE